MLRTLLFHTVGRPVRKSLFLAVAVQKCLLQWTEWLFHKYARALAILCGGSDPKWFFSSSLDESRAYFRGLARQIEQFDYRPKISVILPVYRVEPAILEETLATVALQCYDNWELCIVDDASGNPKLEQVIRSFAEQHPGRIRFAANEQNRHISATSNRCIEMATGEYLALLDHDDRLMPNALAEMVRYINLHDRPEILYSDERVIEPDGKATHLVYCKPDWSPFLHLACNYTTHLTLYRTALVRRIGGFRVGFEGAQDHDLMLRAVEATEEPIVHVPFCLYQWRALETSTAKSAESKPYAASAGIKAVSEACRRRGRPASVEWEPEHFHYRVRFDTPDPLPLVSILIPTKDQPRLLRDCLESIFSRSTYPHFEVILLDNGTTDPEAQQVMHQFAAVHPERVRVESQPGPFNFAALNNRGAELAHGEYLVLLNNDTVVRTPQWIEEMLSFAQFPEVGAVGCKLLYPDGTIQHAGLELQDRRIANHSFKFLPERTTAYHNMTRTVHEVSCVTGACLMIAASKYRAIGGLDQVYLPNGYGDVDFCLRLGQAGYSQVYTPYAVLVHDESRSRGRTPETFERHYMLNKWGHRLVNDPYLNFNLQRNLRREIDLEYPFLDLTGKEFRELLKSAPPVLSPPAHHDRRAA